MDTSRYGIRKEVALPFEEALQKTRTALGEQGFGVLSEIDMQAKIKEKLGADIQHYVILGACNPPLAYKALQAEPEIGLLLPCNVIVYEKGAGQSVVAAIDPDSMVEITANPLLAEVARDAKSRLMSALGSL